MPFNVDVFNRCINANPTKLGGIVAGTNIFGSAQKKPETYDYKFVDASRGTASGMGASGVYSTGGVNESGLAARLDARYDKPRYYSGDSPA